MIDSISFVIGTTGHRDNILPQVYDSIRALKVPDYEIIVVGVVDGMLLTHGRPQFNNAEYYPKFVSVCPDLSYIREELPKHGAKFFWSFGFPYVRKKWVTLVGDDILFKPDWYEKIKDWDAQGDCIGSSVMNPDGTVYCRTLDAFEFRIPDDRVGKVYDSTAFAQYLVTKEIVDTVPIDPYNLAHDKRWGYDIHIKGHRKAFCWDAEVIHLGSAEQFGGRGNVKYAQYTEEERFQMGEVRRTYVVRKCAFCGGKEIEILILADSNMIVDSIVKDGKKDEVV